MIDFRLYRLAFLPAVLAVVVVMFSLQGTPEPLEPVTPPTTFEGDRATAIARQIASQAPDREPGSAGDEAIADLVANRFGEIPAGAVSEQRFDASDGDGNDVTLRNVLLTLPGDADRTIVIAAPRDTATPPGAASSAAATGTLIELANAFRVSHERTFVLASLSGSSSGAAGIQALIEDLPERDSIEAVIVISQPGSAARESPYSVATSSGTASPSIQLLRTAQRAVEVQAAAAQSDPGAFTQLARLAIPSGLGDQAPLIADGFDAVSISSAGERPLAAADDGEEDLAAKSVDDFGRAVQSIVSALDVATEDPSHGPGTWIAFGDNLLPGWALAALALALILPALVAAGDACARSMRQGLALGASAAWAAARCLPFVGGLAVLYGFAIVGAIPTPDFPFDPGLYEPGGRAVLTLATIAIVAAASAWLLHRRGITARAAPDATPYGLGLVASLAALAVWIANPYLGLLVAPTAHVWLLSGAQSTGRRLAAVGACALATLPLLGAFGAVAGALDLGRSAPWTFTLMVADGQIGLLTMLSLCFAAGALLGVLALVLRRRRSLPDAGWVQPPRRAPGEHPGDRTTV